MKWYASLVGSVLLAGHVLAATPRNCGSELNQDTTLYYTFGIQPSSLPYYSDTEVIEGLKDDQNNTLFKQISIARTTIWYDILVYRLIEDDQYVYIIPEDHGGNTWRYTTVTHPDTGNKYFVVYWNDIDDGRYAFYFLPNTLHLCKVLFEN